jgi:glycosyltransferase involved in cell wall biosynthesis
MDWEAVFIDDGSKDGSSIALDNLVLRDNRVKVIHKQNEGVAVAREVGIKAASGSIITFLDIDDTLTPFALKSFATNFGDKDTDIVCAGINIVSENRQTLNQAKITGAEAFSLMCRGRLRWQLCGKAYRRHLFHDVETPRGIRSGEDMAVCMQAALNADKVEVISDCLYNYIQVASSVTHAAAKAVAEDALRAAQFVNERLSPLYGARIATDINSLFMLMASGALRSGIDFGNAMLRDAMHNHFSLKSISGISLHKAISLAMFRYLGLNLAKHL